MSCERYIVRLSGKRLKALTTEGIATMIDLGSLSAYDYIYDKDESLWVRPIDRANELLPDMWKGEEQSFEMPNFHPPAILVPPPESEAPVAPDFESLYGMMKRDFELRQSELLLAKEALAEKDLEFNQLKEELVRQEAKNTSVLSEHVLFQRQLVEKDERLLNLQSDRENLTRQLTETQALVRELTAQVDELDHMASALSERGHSLSELVEQLAIELASAREEIIIQKQRVFLMGEKLASTVELAQDREEAMKRDANTIDHLEKYREAMQRKGEQELEVLIGDAYEILDGPDWYLLKEGEEEGPYAYSELRESLRSGQIDKDTPTRRLGDEEWTCIGDLIEFSHQVVENVTDGGSGPISRFFVRRTEFRAPFYDVAQIELPGGVFKGFCTSISLGGCFVELSRLDLEVMKVGAEIQISISPGALSEGVQIRGMIRNIGIDGPRGLGLSFEGVSAKMRDSIQDYIDSYVHRTQVPKKDVA
jgi:hypothetical protein